jgi:serine/threonine-protein kinase
MSNIENLTIMFTDIVGFSDMVSSLPRAESERILKRHDKLLSKVIIRFGGNIIKSVGDSFLVTFRSPTDATLCAMALHDTLWEANQSEGSKYKLVIRVALNTGEVRLANKDIFGEAVNIAARLESKTPAGAIYLTETVYLSMNKNEVSLEEKGMTRFKGIPQPITVYQARYKKLLDPESKWASYPYGGAHKNLKPASRSIFSVGKLFVGLTAAIIATFVTWWTTITFMPPAPLAYEPSKLEVIYPDLKVVTENDIISFIPDITEEIRSQAEPILKNKNFDTLKELVSKYQAEYPENPYVMMLQGHISMHYKNYESAINNYTEALQNDAALSRNSLLSTNLVELMKHQRLKANQLVASYLSETMIKSLSRRTGQPGIQGRYDAFHLLKDSGNINKVDKVGLNIQDLLELEKCAHKKVAVIELRRLGDPRALPTLKEVMNVGIVKRFKYLCLRYEAGEAIKEIEAKTVSPKASDKAKS